VRVVAPFAVLFGALALAGAIAPKQQQAPSDLDPLVSNGKGATAATGSSPFSSKWSRPYLRVWMIDPRTGERWLISPRK
jgi:hypothetical protein